MKGYIFIRHMPFDIYQLAEKVQMDVTSIYETITTNSDFNQAYGITGWMILLE